MSAGLPIIATDIRGNHDLIRDGENGYLYPVNDKEAFLNAFQKLKNDPKLCKQFSEAVIKDAEQYSIEAVQPQIMALYE